MTKDRKMLHEIVQVIDKQRLAKGAKGSVYSDEHVLDTIYGYISDFLKKIESCKTVGWKVCKSPEFQNDLNILSVQEVADKYEVTYQTVWYHKNK